MRKSAILILLLLCGVALADAVSVINSGTAVITGWTATAAGTILLVTEFIFHLIPTKAPLGWFHIAGNVATALGALFTAVGQFIDKVIPQNIS
jgi:hypothetical protein